MPRDKDVPEVVRAAQTLEDELVRLEALSRSVRKIPLDSEKNIQRAAKELSLALTLPERLGEGLRAFGQAMEQLQNRQQAALDPLAAAASEIQQRTQRLGEHMQSYAALGKASADATALLQSALSGGGAKMEEVDAELVKLVDGARALQEAAKADGFPDVAREADTLRQRVLAFRRKLQPN